MRRSCKDINLRDYKTVLPWVWDCIRRHYKRYDFRGMLAKNGISRIDYARACENSDLTILAPAIKRIAKDAVQRIAERNLALPPIRNRKKMDASTGKERLIGCESAMQQVFDSIATYAVTDIWKRRIVWHQVSSIKGRGPLHGAKIIRKWVQDDNRAMRYAQAHGLAYTPVCKYHVKGDITKCFPSARYEIFMKFFRRDCGNEDLLWLWEELLKSHRVDGYQGFMIGSNVSQWGMQYMLSFVYRYAMSLATERRGKRIKMVNHAIFFMDDLELIGSNRKNLKTAMRKITKYAKDTFGLVIKVSWQIHELETHPIDMMGYVVHRNGKMTIRARVFIRGRRMVLRYHRLRKLTLEQARRLTSYKGNFKHANIRYVRERKDSDEKIDILTACDYAAGVISRYDREALYGSNIRPRTPAGEIHAAAGRASGCVDPRPSPAGNGRRRDALDGAGSLFPHPADVTGSSE